MVKSPIELRPEAQPLQVDLLQYRRTPTVFFLTDFRFHVNTSHWSEWDAMFVSLPPPLPFPLCFGPCAIRGGVLSKVERRGLACGMNEGRYWDKAFPPMTRTHRQVRNRLGCAIFPIPICGGT